MEPHAVPEHAIRCFERLHGLLVTVHDLEGGLVPFLLPERRRHRHPLCIAMQDSGHSLLCRAFDIGRVRQELAWTPAARVQRCPAGLVEWVVPVSGPAGLRCVLFAGPVSDEGLEGRIAVSARQEAIPATRPPTMAPERVELVLEALSQLAARLDLWLREEAQHANGRAKAPAITASLEQRRVTIRQFVHENYGQEIGIADLAKHLGLSPSRTGAVVAAACGMSFSDLLIAARLSSAADLLRHTALPVADIALRCGFTDPSNFFRAFRRRHGTTPLRWRAQAADEAPTTA